MAKKSLIIEKKAQENLIQIALLEDKRLVELHLEKENLPFRVGDIYIGITRYLSKPLNSAFIDIGYERPGFLHYTDLGPWIRSQQKFLRVAYFNKQKIPLSDLSNLPPIQRNGNITQILKSGEPILVQIMKEPISTKGPRLKSHLSFAGFYLVLIPFDKKIRISKKIQSPEKRKQLQEFFANKLPPFFGIIVRTAAQDAPLNNLEKELNQLLAKWEQIVNTLTQLNSKNTKLPTCVYKEENRYFTLIKDLTKLGLDEILVSDPVLYNQIKSYLLTENPHLANHIRYFNPKPSLFEHLGINKQIKRAFGKNVTLPNGISLVIEHTEAVHTIDVNSGGQLKKYADTEQMALQTNLKAVEEIAYQIRLRDMGGIIIIDFIDLKHPENRQKVYKALKEAVEKDRAKVKVLPMSPFGIIQMTRQRVRPQIEIATEETCPTCQGTGKIDDPLLALEQIENQLIEYFKTTSRFFISLYTHPLVSSYMKAHPFRYFWKWLILHGRWVTIKANHELSFLSFRIE